MKKLALGALFAGLLAACGGGGGTSKTIMIQPDGSGSNIPVTCSPLTQTGCNTGEKCTWIIDQTTPTYVGHIGCVMDGAAAVGAACMFGAPGATGFDNCTKGGVCSAFGTTGQAGTCKQICDNSGGQPMCDASHVCVQYSRLFSTGASSPAAAGVCDLACDPLMDNDFDGSGSASAKRANSVCGSANTIGCYGIPSGGTPPATGWSCTGDINANADGTDKGLRHRTECTTANGCADTDGTIYVNSCNQGYLPLFRESTAVSTAVCIAMCKPLDCYAGNCGTNNANRLGANTNACKNPDRVGTFNTGAGREECEYLWSEELDGSGNLLTSPTSDSMGFCFDHGLYFYDSNGDGTVTPGTDKALPGCELLALLAPGSAGGSDPSMPTTYFSARDLGCVNSTSALGSATGKRSADLRINHVLMDRPRFLYHRVMGQN